MPIIDLEEFETHIAVRRLTMEDFDALIEMQRRSFPGMFTWARDQIESQIRTFPEGQLCVEYEGRIVASSSSLVVDFDDYEEWHNWKKISDSGYIRNHDPAGDTLYGIEIMVDPEFRGLKLARRLYNARKQVCRERNLRRIIIGGRIPGYGEHADAMSAREYVEAVISKRLFDPVLTAQLANGFNLEQLIPNYFPSDEASRGYATFLEWVNLDYVPDPRRRFQAVAQARLCLVQYQMRRVQSFEEFATQARFFVDLGSDNKSDFVVFPELFTTTLLCLIDAKHPSDAARKLADFTPQYLELMNELAVNYNVNIIGGSTFAIENDRLYNIAYLFRRDGTIGKQYKLHITPNEARWWGVAGGDTIEVFQTDRGKIAILICYDVEFPELARIAAAKGASIIFVPFNTEERYGYLRVRHCAQARAIENQIYTAISGCAGMLPFVENADMHYAQCGVFTPSDFPFARDAVASESMPNIETVVIHDVDIELLRRNRQTGTVRPWTDRRKDLYCVRFKREDGEYEEVEFASLLMPLDLLKTFVGRRLLFAALYFSEGAPIGFIWWAMPTKLREAGMPVHEVGGITAMLVLPWALKFLWAPLIDAFRGPRWGFRAWVVAAQLMMGLTLAPLIWLPLADHLQLITLLLIAHAFFAATQDVAIDALSIASIPVAERGAVNGWMQTGMLAARGTFGGLALAAEASIGQAGVVVALIGCIWCSGVLLAFVGEPAAAHARRTPRARLVVFAATIRKALSRRGTWIGLAFAATAGAAYEATGGLAGPFLLNAGASKDQVGFFFALPVIVCMVGGALAGGWLSDRAGRRRTVACSLAATALLVSAIAAAPAVTGATTPVLLFGLIGALYLAIGVFTASSYALFMDLTNPDIAGTQFSAFMGATNLCESWSVKAVSLLIAGPGQAVALAVMAAVSLAAIPLTLALGSSRSRDDHVGPPPA